jgi:uroporphyrinogen-III synthase
VPSAVTVVVTRPGAAGEELVAGLQRAGRPALWLPAFEFGAAPDEAGARAVLAAGGFDLAIFVSPQAARATAALLDQPWPAGTAIAAVGAGTRAAVLAAIPGAASATLLAPAGDADASGSESLWPLLQALQPSPRRVLLLRGQSGREWLAERLQEAGATVVPLAVYSRLPYAPTDELRARLASAARTGLACVISSSDAVDALVGMFGGQPDVLHALRAGSAFASHPRIAERLRAVGFARVTVCAPESNAIAGLLREGGG